LMLAAPAPARELRPAAGARQRAAAGARQQAAAWPPGLEGVVVAVVGGGRRGGVGGGGGGGGAVGEAALALRAVDCLSSDHTEPHQSPLVSAVAQAVQKDLRRSALPWEEGEEVGA
jgi:hypothetical protein